MKLEDKKVAIVCDWLVGIGGAERVVLELHKMFPEAPIYTSQYDPKAIDWFDGADVRTTWLQKLPRSLRKFLPVLRAWSFSRLDLLDYDLIISSSGAEAKFIKKLKPGAKHICYCHSPTHYYWIRYDEYIDNPGFGKFNSLARLGLRLLVAPMRRWDYKAAQRPDVMIANSNFTKDNIKKYYKRESTVIFPPVDVDRFKPTGREKRRGFVTAGRQTPYMRKDLAVAACTQLNLPLVVIGNGPEHAKLVKMAGPTIKFVTDASDADVADYFRHAEAFILTGKEDFGIVAVEAMAASTPVIAYKAGGALDYVIPSKTGEFFTKQSTDVLLYELSSVNFKKHLLNELVLAADKYSLKNFSISITELLSSF
ncbi:MAG TPA: glycosyltransferase [Candidatus Saccharimonadales bacterium]|nr:glycosyltransferase [Candidatus Saccharimonadales bacterium]